MSDKFHACPEVDELITLLIELLNNASLPELPQKFEDDEKVKYVYNYLCAVRNVCQSFALGDFSDHIHLKGYVGGFLKNLQANLQHLTWQVEMVANGDFSQRVDFMGEFSAAFNSMVVRLHKSLEDLRQQEELLTSFTESLKKEIAERIKAEEALRISEDRYRTMAALDSLTGQYNRRHFMHLASVELERLRRKGRVFSLCMLDADHFKKFNDTYGHLNGDACLKHIVGVISKVLRKVDILARYGGEEFVIFLPETHQQAALLVAERIRHKIESTPVLLESGETAHITLSIGVTTMPSDFFEGSPEDILRRAIQRADIALYEAKTEGRNRVKGSAALFEPHTT